MIEDNVTVKKKKKEKIVEQPSSKIHQLHNHKIAQNNIMPMPFLQRYQGCLRLFFFKHKTAYEITRCLEFRRVLFRSRILCADSFRSGWHGADVVGSGTGSDFH